MGQDSAWRRGDSFCFRLRKKRKKEKKAIRHRGVGAPNKGMSRNRSRDTMGLIGPGKTMLRSGPLQGSGAPTSTREWDLPSHGFSRQLRCPKVSKGRAESPLARPQAQNLFLAEVLTRRLRRGSRACSPMGRSHFSFGGERKVCKRKPAARRLREKGFYCPFWRRGSLCRAQHDWPDFTCDPARSELAFFCRQNGRAFFPPLPIAALAPRGRRRAYLTLAG